jgi:peptidoglycan LD-endopeptidase CwlK
MIKRLNKYHILALAGAIGLGAAWLVRGRLYSYAGEIWDHHTEKRIEELHPAIRDKVRQFIMNMQSQGINLRIPPTGTIRSFEEQAQLYAQGRTMPGNIVTNADAGQSYHNYGLAFDVVEIDNLGQALYENDNWPLIREVGQMYGFDVIGMWDPGHFEYRKYGDWPQLLAMYNADQIGSHGYLLV